MAKSRKSLEGRVAGAAERTLAAQKYVSAIDVLMGIGWLDGNSLKRWRQGQVDCLERVVQANLSRISEAMQLLRSWARDKGLNRARQPTARAGMADPAVQPQRRCRPRAALPYPLGLARAVRAKTPAPGREGAGAGSGRDRAAARRLDLPPLRRQWRLADHENEGPACLPCVGLGDLQLLPAGDALPARRAKARSAPCGGGALQQDPQALRAPGPPGRAAGLEGGRARGRGGEGIAVHRGTGPSPPFSLYSWCMSISTI